MLDTSGVDLLPWPLRRSPERSCRTGEGLRRPCPEGPRAARFRVQVERLPRAEQERRGPQRLGRQGWRERLASHTLLSSSPRLTTATSRLRASTLADARNVAPRRALNVSHRA
jgi:hypothetical protein